MADILFLWQKCTGMNVKKILVTDYVDKNVTK